MTSRVAFPLRFPAHWPAAAVLLVMFALALTSMTADSPTFDEQGFLVRGLAWLRGEEDGGNRHMRVGHPLGLNALNAALLVSDPSVRLPSDHPSWAETSFHRPAELFLWEIGNDVEHIMFLARLPTIWLGLLLAAVGARWAAEMAAGWAGRSGSHRRVADIAGLVTLVLLAFDPNIMAHTRLVTTDLGLTAAAALAGYTLWRFLSRPSWRGAVVAGAALGLMLNTKFTALLFLPLFGAVALVGIWWNGVRMTRISARIHADKEMDLIRENPLVPRHSRTILLAAAVIIPAVAFLTLWAGHGFQVGPLRAPLSVLGHLGGAAVPLSDYFDQLLDIGNRLEVSTPSFLLGRHSDSGWWYYFPVAFLLKTPAPVLLLLGWALIRVIRLFIIRRKDLPSLWFDAATTLIPAGGFFAIALTTDINLGYRHILPVLPFLYVLTGCTTGQALVEWRSSQRARAPRYAIAALLVWLVAVSVGIYPHYLAFFNALAGGPDGGWRALVDSNLDWGQDLGRLADRLDGNDTGRVWLSYFGEARPDYYGIDYEGVDSFPPRLMNPDARPFYPHDPAPGWYAISATNLQGVHFADHDQFAYFRDREPEAKVGYSIFLYEQPARGPAADLLLAGTQVDDISPDEFARLGTNDVELRWFDPAQAVVLPGGARPIWLAMGAEPLHTALRPFLDGVPENAPTAGEPALAPVMARLPAGEGSPFMLRLDGGEIAFLGSEVNREGGKLLVRTAWRQEASPRPVKIFVHVLDDAGQIVAQWDGLGAAWEGWREGDTLVHIHEIAAGALPAGPWRVVAGLYDPESLGRWTGDSGDDGVELVASD